MDSDRDSEEAPEQKEEFNFEISSKDDKFELETAKIIENTSGNHGISSLAYEFNQEELAVGYDNGMIHVYDLKNSELEIENNADHRSAWNINNMDLRYPVTSMQWLFQKKALIDDIFRHKVLVCSNGGGMIEFWDISKKDKLPIETIEERKGRGTYCLAIDNAHEIMATGGTDK